MSVTIWEDICALRQHDGVLYRYYERQEEEQSSTKLVRRNVQTIVPNASPNLFFTDFHFIQSVQ